MPPPFDARQTSHWKGEQGDRSMSEAKLNATDLPLFHPAAHYASPDEVMDDPQLCDAEKRIILSSWASDMFAVESCPGLRDIPGMGHPLRLADILSALRRLDGGDDPPRGEIGTRWRRRPRWGASPC
jgi:hypothetical protein